MVVHAGRYTSCSVRVWAAISPRGSVHVILAAQEGTLVPGLLRTREENQNFNPLWRRRGAIGIPHCPWCSWTVLLVTNICETSRQGLPRQPRSRGTIGTQAAKVSGSRSISRRCLRPATRYAQHNTAQRVRSPTEARTRRAFRTGLPRCSPASRVSPHRSIARRCGGGGAARRPSPGDDRRINV